MSERFGRKAGDWVTLRCGDLVTEIDKRHVGRVEAIRHGAFAKVCWLETGCTIELPVQSLRLMTPRPKGAKKRNSVGSHRVGFGFAPIIVR
jgi:hypothetical protein